MIPAIIQARLNSSRYPKKMTKAKIGSSPILYNIIFNLQRARQVSKIVLAVPYSDNDRFKELFNKKGVPSPDLIVAGEEKDVLGRFIKACDKLGFYENDWILRICGDSPWPEPLYINDAILKIRPEYDAVVALGYPLGQQVECFKVGCLKTAQEKLNEAGLYRPEFIVQCMEHIDPILEMKENGKKLFNVLQLDNVNLSLDTEEDEKYLNSIT